MAVERTVKIDVEGEVEGQYSRIERWQKKVEVKIRDDGRVQVGELIFQWSDLESAVSTLREGNWVR